MKSLACVLALVLSPLHAAIPGTDLFTAGEGGSKSYRIPSLISTGKGSLLAFAEARRQSAADAGDIDLVMRRSTDGGKTWSEPTVVWDDGANTCGNPCPVVDESTGTVWLLGTWNLGADHEPAIIAGKSKDTRRVFVMHSKDDGLSWSQPHEITRDVKKPEWTWYATGPGAGIRLSRGPHAGRLVIPCDHIEAGTKRYFSHVIYSDDHGQSWKTGGSSPRDRVNECEVAELSDGRLVLNMRNYDPTQRARQICVSDDGGLTWRDQKHDPTLIEPICQASIRRLSWPTAGKPGVLLFSNPADAKARRNLTVRASLDDGATWPRSLVIDPDGAAYSCLARLDDDSFALLYETAGYKTLRFLRLHLSDLRP